MNALLGGPLGDWLEKQAAVRENARKQAGNRLFWALLLLLPSLAFAWIVFPQLGEFLLWGGIALAAIAWGWSQIPKQRAKKQVKIGINRAIAESLGLHYECECRPGLPFQLARMYRLVPKFDRSRFEDKWTGLLGDFPFELFEAKLEERRGSGKNSRWVTVFQGVILSIGFRRRFHGITLVARDGMFRSLFFGRKDSVEFQGERLQAIGLSDPRFEDAFDVWSNDPVEAHYLVHPAYVERLVALEAGFRGRDIRALFHEGQLVVVLASPNLFESGSIDAADDRARIERTIEQFGRMADLATTLNEPAR